MIGKEKQDEVIGALKAQAAPVQQLPALSFTDHYQVAGVGFESHLDGKLPVPRYLPLHLDVGASPLGDEASSAEQVQEHFVKFMMVQQCVDVMIAFAQDHKMAASNLIKLYKSTVMEANESQLFDQCVRQALFS